MYVALPFLYGNFPFYFSTGKIAALLRGAITMMMMYSYSGIVILFPVAASIIFSASFLDFTTEHV